MMLVLKENLGRRTKINYLWRKGSGGRSQMTSDIKSFFMEENYNDFFIEEKLRGLLHGKKPQKCF